LTGGEVIDVRKMKIMMFLVTLAALIAATGGRYRGV